MVSKGNIQLALWSQSNRIVLISKQTAAQKLQLDG